MSQKQDDRIKSIMRLHCLSRLEKLRAKLEDKDWGISVDKELMLLVNIQTELTLVLHDLGVRCFIGDDMDITDKFDLKM